MKTNLLLIVSIISVSVFISVVVISNAIRNRNESNNVISVTGMAERNFESDLIVWKSQFTVKNSNLTSAYAELKKQGEATRKFLESREVGKAEMTFSAVEITKEYVSINSNGTSISTFDGYRLTQQVSITSSNVSKIEGISREITELINDGIEITSMPPAYFYTKLSDLKIKMLAEASQDGLIRAKTIAENGNADLGRLVNSSMGVFQIVAQNSTEDYSWGGALNTSSKKKTASVTVKLQYMVK
ncbi:MAG: SIMPL domain-containing protein [Paludibacter sp.]